MISFVSANINRIRFSKPSLPGMWISKITKSKVSAVSYDPTPSKLSASLILTSGHHPFNTNFKPKRIDCSSSAINIPITKILENNYYLKLYFKAISNSPLA